ncbi:MAG: DsbA family protein [Mariprofundaceae bacterium]|nr:DsbA family protein [Mariprofundaceae bacterium]
MKTLYYVHDPMCSWCWAFRPVWQELQNRLPENIETVYLLGGLAPDSQAPMSPAMQQEIRNHWKTIQEQVPGIMFNFEFWQHNTPRRSTYPACRAVIAARNQERSVEDAMIHAIQKAYYLQAENPSDDEVLIHCAETLGLDISRFRQDLHDPATGELLFREIRLAQRMQVFSFPSLVLKSDGSTRPIYIDYLSADKMLSQLTA